MSCHFLPSDRKSRSAVVPYNAAGRRAVGELSELPPRLMRRVLECLADPHDRLALSQTCWCLFVFVNEEPYWKTLCLQPPFIDPATKHAHWNFKGSWKQTALHPRRGDLYPFPRLSEEAAPTETTSAAATVVNEQFRTVEAMHAARDEAGVTTESEIALRLAAYLRGAVAPPPARDTMRATSSSKCDVHTAEDWNVGVVGKPYCPGLSTRVFGVAQGAVNYVSPSGELCVPPLYALQYGVLRTDFVTYKSHNTLGDNLLEVVPLLPPYTSAAFYGTWNHKMAFVEACGANPGLAYTPLMAPPSSSSSSPASSLLPLVYDEQVGVPGVVDRRYRLSVEDFQAQYEATNTPVVLTGCIDHWPAREKWLSKNFCTHYGEAWVKPNGRSADGRRFRLRARDFFAYARSTNGEKPMYVFDKKILTNESGLQHDYDIPPYFREDYFSTMAEEDRPDYQWLLVGPDGSGTPYHTDPHASSAWNAVLDGVKRFSFYHPDVVPPGVKEELIHTEYYASQPYMEWYCETLPSLVKRQQQQQQQHESHQTASSADAGCSRVSLPLEALVFPGDIVFVPSGWWHQVINYGLTIAVTQNVCSRFTFPRVAQDMNTHAGAGVRRDFAEALSQAGYTTLAAAITVPPRGKRQRNEEDDADDEDEDTSTSDDSSSETDSTSSGSI